MVEKDNIVAGILETCPSFKSSYEACHNKESLYSIAGTFADHLFDLYRHGNFEEFSKVGELIEDFIVLGDEYVQEYAVVGILEDIQNVWLTNKLDPGEFAAFLRPASVQYWESLNRFWKREIPYVGSDVQ